MKLALVIEHFDSTRGGAEHFTVWLAQQLAARTADPRGGGAKKHEVHIICHDLAAQVNRYRQATQRASHDADRSHQAHPPAPGDEILPDGLHIHRLRGMRLNSGLGFRRFGRRAAQCAGTLAPDVVHSMTVAFPGDLYHPHAGIYAAIQAQAIASRATNASAKWKQLMLRLSLKQRTLLALEKRALARAGGPAKVISLSPMMTRQFREHYPALAPGRIIELPNPRMTPAAAVDSARAADDRQWFRAHYRLAPEDRVAIFVGHDFRRKGLRYAIEAIAKTKTRWKLLVVGLGKAREYIELADMLKLGENSPGGARVLFVGPTRETDRAYAAADALLLPTFYDSFGLVAIEALSHGLPVVSTEFLGAGNLITQHHVGTLVPTPKHIDEMAAALDALPRPNTPDHTALAARARTASNIMPPDTYLGTLESLYEQIAAPHPNE
jgi:UDP-glucose:(heptosyl)LPS alpha-1,3-glucosyltransferase